MLRVRINWTGPASGFSVLHFDGELSTSGAAQAAADAASSWLEDIAPHLADAQAGRVDPEVLEVNISNGQTTGVGTVTSTTWGGTGGNNQVSQASQLLVQWRTGVFAAGRELRGRTFIPGVGAAGSTPGGEVAPATADAIVIASQSLADDAADLGVYSPTRSAFATVATATVWPEFAVLRGRRQ